MEKIKKAFSLDKNSDKKHKFICKECSKETFHIVISGYSEKGIEDCGDGNSVDWNETHQIIQCQGCETVSFRIVSTFSEDYELDHEGIHYNKTVTYFPGRSEGLKAINSFLLPENVQNIYKETVLAIENEQNILAGIGIRALIETVCKDLNAEGKDLYHKINTLHEKSIVTKEGVYALHKLRVLGNNSAHEVKQHNTQQLLLAIEIIEHMVEGTYILPHKVSDVFK